MPGEGDAKLAEDAAQLTSLESSGPLGAGDFDASVADAFEQLTSGEA